MSVFQHRIFPLKKYPRGELFLNGLLLLALLTLAGCKTSLPAGFDLKGWWQGVATGKVELVTTGLKQGVRLDALNKNGDTPLTLALKMNQARVAALLINAGAAVNTVGGDGLSPLFHAIYFDRPGIIRLLVEHKVKMSGTNRYGQDPLELAVLRSSPSVLAELAMAAPEIHSRLTSMIEQRVGEPKRREHLLALIELRKSLSQVNDEEPLWNAINTLQLNHEKRSDSGISSLYLLEAFMDRTSPAYNPERALALLNDCRLRRINEKKQPLLNKWAQSGNSYAQALLGSGLINSSTVNNRPLAREFMLESARNGNPLARILLNDQHRQYLPELRQMIRDLLSFGAENPEEMEAAGTLPPQEFLETNQRVRLQLERLQDLADCGVVLAEFALELLHKTQAANFIELSQTLLPLLTSTHETELEVACTCYGQKTNPATGDSWLQRAEVNAISGSQMYDLGRVYENGCGHLPASSQKALAWYQKAATRHTFDAQSRLFTVYSEGQLGEKRDLLKALSNYRIHGDWMYRKKLHELGPKALRKALVLKDQEAIKNWLQLLGPDNDEVQAAWEDSLKTAPPEQCQLFVEAGVDPDRPLHALAPLSIASGEGQLGTLQWLLSGENGAHLEKTILSEALIAAALAQRLDGVRVLLAHGAQFPAITSPQGMTLVKETKAAAQEELLSLILGNQPSTVSEEQILQVKNRLEQEAQAQRELQQWRSGTTIVRYDDQGDLWKPSSPPGKEVPWCSAGDSKSGLVWMIKDESEGLNGAKRRFTDARTSASRCTVASCSVQGYRDLARKEQRCGHADWRLPTVAELESLAFPHMEQAFPAWPGYLQWAVEGPQRQLLLIHANGLLGHRRGVIAFGGASGQVLLVRGELHPLPQPAKADFMHFKILPEKSSPQ